MNPPITVLICTSPDDDGRAIAVWQVPDINEVIHVTEGSPQTPQLRSYRVIDREWEIRVDPIGNCTQICSLLTKEL